MEKEQVQQKNSIDRLKDLKIIWQLRQDRILKQFSAKDFCLFSESFLPFVQFFDKPWKS